MLLGYLEFVFLLFFPGFATLLLFNQVKETNVVTVIARSYGLSLALNALVMFVALTVANTSTGRFFVGLTGLYTRSLPAVILGLSALLVVALGYLRFRGTTRLKALPILHREESIALMFGAVFVALSLSEFLKYPIFPKTYSVDYLQHYNLMQVVISRDLGGGGALLYYGVHYNLAMGYLLVGGDPFVQTQYLMAILATPCSLLFFEVSRRFYSSPLFALLVQALFVGTGFLWYIPLFNSGLYPNLFSIILSLAFLIELTQLMGGSSRLNYVTFAIITLGMYLSHYSAVALIAGVSLSLIVLSALRLLDWRKSLAPLLITVAPLATLLSNLSLVQSLVHLLGQTATTGGFGYSTPLADSFSFSPFLEYSVAIIYNYGSIVILLGLPLALYYVWVHRKQSPLLVMFAVWFLLLWAASPPGELSWRFALVATTPLLFLAPAVFWEVPPFVNLVLGRERGPRRKQRFHKSERPYGRLVAYAILILVMLGGSWGNVMVEDLSLNTAQYSQAQVDLYNTMTWFGQNSPTSAKLLSPTDWRIIFLDRIAGRVGQVILFAPANDTIQYARSNGYDYILVTYFMPVNVPSGFDLASFYGSYSNDQNLKPVYQHGFDVIYQLVK